MTECAGDRLENLARRESFLVVDVAEDPVHQIDVGNPAVACWIPDHGHEVVRLRGLRECEWCRRRLATELFDAQERDIRAVRLLDVQDLSEFECQAVLAFDLLEEIDGGAHRVSVQALPEDEPRSTPATELSSNVPVGHDGLRGDKPTRPDPREAVALHFDPAHGLGRMHEMRACRREP
nr:hypothetical protein [Rhodococcus sp. MTM3W5.2]